MPEIGIDGRTFKLIHFYRVLNTQSNPMRCIMREAVNDCHSASTVTPGTAGVVARIEAAPAVAKVELKVVKARTAMPCSIPQY